MAGIMVLGLAGCQGELNQADHLPRRIREQSRLGAARHHRMPPDLTIWMGSWWEDQIPAIVEAYKDVTPK